MNHSIFLLLFLFSMPLFGQVTLVADGPGDTYELITSVLAPGSNPIETPDCNHQDFGNHIDEIYDEELDAFVFRFHMHVTPDDDRCINFDRQRNEIKSYSPSPDNLLGIEEEEVIYKWKFKLDEGFQSSSSFTHIHQLKSVGGPQESMPMYTLTTRKGSPDQLELRYAETTSQTTLTKTDLAPFIGTWVEVEERIEYGNNGSYEIEIKRISDQEILFSYSDASIINWRIDADFVRPKWGIYRSLNSAQDLRDETVLFADFSVEEVGANSIGESNTLNIKANVFYDSVNQAIVIKELANNSFNIKLLDINGRVFKDIETENTSELIIDTSSYSRGSYVLSIQKNDKYYTKIIVIQ